MQASIKMFIMSIYIVAFISYKKDFNKNVNEKNSATDCGALSNDCLVN